MNLAHAIVIARANLTRLFRDRLGLFFIVVLPLIIILVLGLQFGSGFDPRLAVAAAQPGALGEELVEALDADLSVTRLDDADAVRDVVERGRADLGLVLPDNYEERLRAGESVAVEIIGPPDNVAIGLQRLVSGAVAAQSALFQAARFAASETGAAPELALETARGISSALPPLEVEVSSAGERLFPENLTGFALGAQSQLVLFVFVTSMNGAALLILSRQLGVSRRMLSTPTRMSTILVGEGLGRFAVALFQALFIVAATALAFGVTWGDPIAAGALIVAFSLVSAGVAMLIGAVANNPEQAGSVGVFAGLGVAALGGAMVPPEIFPSFMQVISRLTPHRWALEGFRELISGGDLASILPQLAVLVAAAAVFFMIATWRLRVALTR